MPICYIFLWLLSCYKGRVEQLPRDTIKHVPKLASSDFPGKFCKPLQQRRTTLECPAAATVKSLQSCPPIDRSPPGSPVPGILQARTLEWVAISFSNA